MGAEPVGSNEEGQAAVAAAALPQHYFELYTLAVEMADRISARRGIANSFFLTVNTGLAAVLGSGNLRWYVAGAGIVFCVTWWALLKSYRELNRAKFDIIVAMEDQLPVRVFGDEWDRLKPPADETAEERTSRRRERVQQRLGQYRELGEVEKIVPIVFALIYAAELVRQVLA